MTHGYYQFPTIFNDTIAFASEDDLWSVPASGGIARRLTSGIGSATSPVYSRDGKWLAFSGREEGPLEVFVMPADGGQAKRLTFLGVDALVCGWTNDGRIVFSSTHQAPFLKMRRLFTVSIDRASDGVQLLPVGPAQFASFGPAGETVIQRPSVDPAYWKRYRGGTAGDLWIDPTNSGAWRRLIALKGNPSHPLWIGRRIYFSCDHEGIGNLYSCNPSGQDLQRHTNHEDFYIRNLQSDGRRIVYRAGGDVHLFDPETNKTNKVAIQYHGPRTQRNRKFIDASRWLESYSPHPQGHLITLTTRGKIATLGNFDGPVTQIGEPNTGRYRMAGWMKDGKRLVAVNDTGGGENLVILSSDGSDSGKKIDIGGARVVGLKVSPTADEVVISNVREELIHVNLETGKRRVLDKSEHTFIQGFDISPDGKWAAYSWSPTPHTAIIRLVRLEDGAKFDVTKPVLMDVGPSFDPDGKFLYFLSRRDFDPVYDGMHFDLGFPKGMRPYLVTLRADVPNPFRIEAKPAEDAAAKKEDEKKDEAPATNFSIDLDGIQDRILAFPVAEAIYQQIEGIKGKALVSSVQPEGALKNSFIPSPEPGAKATLDMFDFATAKAEPVMTNISSFTVSRDRKTCVVRVGSKLRVLKAGEKADEAAAKEPPGRKSGWIDLKRVRLSVEPTHEWKQMFDEAWRLQREQFWVEDMADVDWQSVHDRYAPLLDRVSTRNEFTDVLWEMQGELGSSHAYAVGGDARTEPSHDVGFLGADFTWDDRASTWRVAKIAQGDVWDEENAPPLRRAGVNVKEGAAIVSINGRKLTREVSPQSVLVNQAAQEVALTVLDKDGAEPRVLIVKTIKNELMMRYRAWVDANRKTVHDATGGRCGYVHVPNMGPLGYAEFHRGYLAEVDREGLVIDVRYNGGGHVSALLLEKLARKRIAYCQSRWFGVQPWPEDSSSGALVALTNEYAGSDGDIFSQNFKAMKLGPLIGKRTWGGVIGIWPRHTLVDGGLTTQPEFSFWFRDVGWNVENYGVDPDIEVEFPPIDHVNGTDPQLKRGVDELMKILEKHDGKPNFEKRPSRAFSGKLQKS